MRDPEDTSVLRRMGWGLWEMCACVREKRDHAFFMYQGIFWTNDPPKACQHFSLQEKITQYLRRIQDFTRTQGLVGPRETWALSLAPGGFNFLWGQGGGVKLRAELRTVDSW